MAEDEGLRGICTAVQTSHVIDLPYTPFSRLTSDTVRYDASYLLLHIFHTSSKLAVRSFPAAAHRRGRMCYAGGRPNYQAYLLLLWRDGELEPWRASPEAPGHAEIHTFGNLKALIAFLLE